MAWPSKNQVRITFRLIVRAAAIFKVMADAGVVVILFRMLPGGRQIYLTVPSEDVEKAPGSILQGSRR